MCNKLWRKKLLTERVVLRGANETDNASDTALLLSKRDLSVASLHLNDPGGFYLIKI